VATNRGRVRRGVEDLAETSGEYAFSQRDAKLGLQTATLAPAATASGTDGFRGAEAEHKSLRMSGGGFFGGNVRYYDALGDQDKAAFNCRQIGRKTFFERGGKLVDSTVSEEQEKSCRKIERYSREYFDLIEQHGKHVAQYLALDEPVVINLGGETYEW
jgi:hypothetical protein